MAERDYVRLAAACHCGEPVKLWAGVGRKPTRCDSHAKVTVPRQPARKMCRDCGAGIDAVANRRYCEACSAKRMEIKSYCGCEHQKPTFASGRERKFCYACLPPPPARPRKKRGSGTYKRAEPAKCAAPDCGMGFTQKLPHGRFCSTECRVKVRNRVVQEKRRNSQPRPCRWCGTVYVPEYGSRRNCYCTTECAETAHRKVRSGSTHRRRAAKFGGTYEPVRKRVVFEREGWRCYLCGCDTPKELSGTKESNAPELEHVVPLSRGGDHTYSNVRCACRRCNRAKGARLIEQRPHALAESPAPTDRR